MKGIARSQNDPAAAGEAAAAACKAASATDCGGGHPAGDATAGVQLLVQIVLQGLVLLTMVVRVRRLR